MVTPSSPLKSPSQLLHCAPTADVASTNSEPNTMTPSRHRMTLSPPLGPRCGSHAMWKAHRGQREPEIDPCRFLRGQAELPDILCAVRHAGIALCAVNVASCRSGDLQVAMALRSSA